MAAKPERLKHSDDALVSRLVEIESLLESMLIIQGATAGMSKAAVRKMLGVANARVSAIWRNIPSRDQGED